MFPIALKSRLIIISRLFYIFAREQIYWNFRICSYCCIWFFTENVIKYICSSLLNISHKTIKGEVWLIMDGKSLKTRIFNDRKEAQDFLENLPNEYEIIQRATLRKAIQELETSDCVNEIMVIYMRCNKGNEKIFSMKSKRRTTNLFVWLCERSKTVGYYPPSWH